MRCLILKFSKFIAKISASLEVLIKHNMCVNCRNERLSRDAAHVTQPFYSVISFLPLGLKTETQHHPIGDSHVACTLCCATCFACLIHEKSAFGNMTTR